MRFALNKAEMRAHHARVLRDVLSDVANIQPGAEGPVHGIARARRVVRHHVVLSHVLAVCKRDGVEAGIAHERRKRLRSAHRIDPGKHGGNGRAIESLGFRGVRRILRHRDRRQQQPRENDGRQPHHAANLATGAPDGNSTKSASCRVRRCQRSFAPVAACSLAPEAEAPHDPAMSYRPEDIDALARTAGARWMDELATIVVSGEDAKAWLNGQLTNDLREVDERRAVYGLFLTPRGKILADAWVVARGEALVAMVPATVTSALLSHLEKYVIMEDVTLAVSDARVMSVQGLAAADIAREVDQSISCDRLGLGGFDWIVDASGAETLAGAIDAQLHRVGGRRVSREAWEATRIERGRAAFGADFWDAHYPQEAGLETRAVSFSKGCYLGQEVVCTLENRGQINRRLVQLTSKKGGVCPSPGEAITAEDGTVIGQVTSSASTSSGPHSLGYVKRRLASLGQQVRIAGVEALISALL